jgi:hypothetical protein
VRVATIPAHDRRLRVMVIDAAAAQPRHVMCGLDSIARWTL